MDELYGEQHKLLQREFDTAKLVERVKQFIVLPEITDEHKAFIESRDMFFLTTIDHRGYPTCSYKLRLKYFTRLMMIILLTILILLSGCATIGSSNVITKITGRVEKIESTTRLNQPSDFWLIFGLIGAIIQLSNVGPVPTNRYSIRLEQGTVKTILIDSEFQVGECVEIIIPSEWESKNDFRYGEVEIESSIKCAFK